MKSTALAAALALACLLPASGQAVEVAGIDIADSQQTSVGPLVLNGAGLRRVFIFKVYVASLYLPKKTASAAQVLNPAERARLTLTLLRSLTADKLINALHEGLRDNVSADQLAALKTPLHELDSLMRKIGEGKEGDTVTLDFQRDSVAVHFNSVSQGVVSAPNLNTALLSIWLGRDPVDAHLKQSLLGS